MSKQGKNPLEINEIIRIILSLLPSSDKKNARLINSQWYEESKGTSILKKQKFILDGFIYKDQMSSIFDVLNNAKFTYYNLEFYNENFHSSSEIFLNFIKSNSECIYGLSFTHCSFKFIMLEEIMISCPKLIELYFENCVCAGFENATLLPHLKEKLVRANFKTLEVVKCHWMTNYVFNIFVSIYPNIEKINFTYLRIKCSISFSPDRNDLREPPFWIHCLFSNNKYNIANLKYLSLNKPKLEKSHLTDFSSTTPWFSNPNLRLKELNARDHEFTTEANFRLWVSKQEQLTSVDFRCADFDLNTLEFLLRECPNLQSLQFSNDYLEGDELLLKRVLELISKSKLIFLNITPVRYLYFLRIRRIPSFYSLCHNDSLNFPDYAPNYNTRHLGIHTVITERLLITLLKMFCNLSALDFQDIHIRGPEEAVAEFIFHRQINLKSLKLSGCSWINDDVFKNCELRKLERLELLECEISDTSLKEFNFPKLKFLHLENCQQINDQSFAQLPEKCPLIEYLKLLETKMQSGILEYICAKLRFLRYIQVREADWTNPIQMNIETISRHCPSLRYIEMGVGIRAPSYAYNCFHETWMQYDYWKQCCKRRSSINDRLVYAGICQMSYSDDPAEEGTPRLHSQGISMWEREDSICNKPLIYDYDIGRFIG